MRKYLSFFRIRFVNSLQYRSAAAAGIATQFAWGGLEILAYRAFFQASPESFPMGFGALASYIWLRQALLALYMTWFFENEIFESITKGNIAYELARPIGIYAMRFTRSMANRLSKAVLRCMPILLVAALLPAPYGIGLPADFKAGFWFVITAVLGFLVTVSFCMLIYISAFYTISTLGVRVVATTIADFLGGSLIPLPFLPENIRELFELLPFAAMIDVPFRVYGGDITGNEIYERAALQLFWEIVLTIIGVLLTRRALRRVTAQGG